jgi:hypothetical protein
MNERIKELYNQSLEQKYQYGGSDSKPGEMYSNYITVLNPEKFAELIVQEAITIVNKRYMGDNNREDMEVRRCVEDLKKHFGVE